MTTRFLVSRPRRGFTLIELLIVIGLLGALAALVLPSMIADREKAMEKICDYNNAGTLRVLKQYQAFTGKLPNGLHTGLKVPDSASSSDQMDGMPDAQVTNLNREGTVTELTLAEANALKAVGITELAYDTGLHYATVAAGTSVLRCTPAWRDDGDVEYQFAGKSISEYETDGAKVFVFYVTPTVNWQSGGNNDWGEGNVKVSLDLPGKCPVPVSSEGGIAEFAYYMAYIAVTENCAVVSSTTSASTITAPSLGSTNLFASVSEAQSAIEGTFTAETGLSWDASSSWTETTTGNGVWQRTANYALDNNDDGDTEDAGETGTITYTVTDKTGSGVATLIGTSCPECGVLNP